MGRPSASRIASAAAVLGGGILLALPIVELGVRMAGLAPDIRFIDVTNDDTVYRRSENPVLGFELKAGWRDPDADLTRSYPSTNAHGQRDVERTLAKPAGVRRILLVGASVVEGVGVREIRDTMSGQLEAMLGAGSEVLNFGVSAYCTRAQVELLRAKGLAFDPDVVVLVHTRNDFDNFNRQAFQLAAARKRPAVVEAAFRRSHAFRALAVRLDLFGYRAQAEPAAWNAEAIGDNNVVDGLALLAELARAEGFDPLVAVWPRFADDAIEDAGEVPGRPGELVIEALCRMHGMPCFRFSRHFAADLAANAPGANPRTRYTIGDRVHPNEEGCRVAAAALAEELPARAGEFARAAPRPRDEAAVAAARALGQQIAVDSRRLVNVGNELLAAGRTEDAVDAYRRAIAADPRMAEAHHNLGVALRSAGRLEEALLEFAQAAQLDPDLADAPLNFGITLLRLGRPRDALPALERAVAMRPESAPARAALEEARRAADAGR